ncbi:MAG TPA: DinB family protein [Bryobacteraceae bacterium]|nr:DinB family protein [Bryobacteraceae bacterium]
MPPLTPELAQIEQQLVAVKAEASSLVNGLKITQFNWRPDGRGWSVAECLLHLNMVGHRYVNELDAVLAEARAQGRTAAGPFGYGMFGKWILENTEPPPKRKFKARRPFRPTEDQPVTAVLPTFLHLQDQLSRQLEQASGLDLAHIKVPAPGFGPVRLNLHITLAWIAAHERRHLWQARQVLGHAAFPRPDF